MTSNRISRFTSLLLATSATPAALHAQELPRGGTVVAGSASIGTPQGGSLSITQNSDRAIINWQGFSIGQGGTVSISQPDANSALLNRVTSDATSVIAGQINANGRVYLVNPNGVLITKTGVVNAAAFTASTLDIADNDFVAGSTSFTVTASRAAKVITLRSGLADLSAPTLSDHALLYARIDRMKGSGKAALDLTGDGFLRVALLAGGITVAGAINAHEVVLTAGTARDAARGVVNLSGTINATSVSSSGGIVRLTGETITLAGATIDALGATGGGTIEIGGGLRGEGDLAHATTVTVDAASTIRADATQAGNGGSVALWSDGATQFAGVISAKGGVSSGDGGIVETSGHTANLNGARISTIAANGSHGTWLIDPVNFTVAASGGDITGAQLSSNLANGNVTILSSNGTRGTAGDININDTVSWGANTLTLDAYHDINVNMVLSATGTAGFVGIVGDTAQNGSGSSSGALRFGLSPSGFAGRLDIAAAGSFRLNGQTYTILTSLGAQGSITRTDLQGISGNVTGFYVLGSNIDASATATWNAGLGFAPIGNFSGSFNGLGHVISNFNVNRPTTDNIGLFGSLSGSGSIRNVGLMAASVSGRTGVGGLVGRNVPVSGTISASYATGTVSGSSFVGGLVGNNSGTVSMSYATGTVSGTAGGAGTIGGLVGNSNGTVSMSYATGAVSGPGTVGGLVGNNLTGGTITTSYATGTATAMGGANNFAGGLVAQNGGTINTSYATGAVSGNINVGGLVAFTSGTISNSYATGAVNGSNFVGGLVGAIGGTGVVRTSYATGTVSSTGTVGGLAGNSAIGSMIISGYWDSYSTGQSQGVGANFGTVTDLLAVTSDPSQSGAANYAFRASAWANLTGGIDTVGGQATTWRIYEGFTYPLLKAFLTTVQVGVGVNDNRVYNGVVQNFGGNFSLSGNANPSFVLGSFSDASAKDVGTYTVNINRLYSTQQGYDLTAGSFTITPAALTITGGTSSVVYDAAAHANIFTAEGLLGNDSVTGVSGLASGTNVGSYVDSLSNATGTGLGNYTIAYVNGGGLTITPTALTVINTGASAGTQHGSLVLSSGIGVSSDDVIELDPTPDKTNQKGGKRRKISR